MTGPAHRSALSVDLRHRQQWSATATCDGGDWTLVVRFADRADCLDAYRLVRDAAAEHEREANDGLTDTTHHHERRIQS